MPITSKIEKPEDQSLLNLVPDKTYWEVAIGPNFYKLYSLPADAYINLMIVIQKIWTDLLEGKTEERNKAMQIAKDLANRVATSNKNDFGTETSRIVKGLSESSNIASMEFFMSPALSSSIKDILDIVLYGVDQSDRDELNALQLANVLEAVFLLNFSGFIRVVNSARRLFRPNITDAKGNPAQDGPTNN